MSTIETLLAPFPVVVRQTVQWGDMDYYRHVNNVVYFRYFENARLEFFRRLDWQEYERATGIGPILAATSARFRRSLTYPDTIAIGTCVVDLRADRFTLEYLIVSEVQQAAVTEGSALVVTFHYGEGRKVAIPEDLRRRIEALQRPDL
jgi:acyl-CoA thioester hydrolase